MNLAEWREYQATHLATWHQRGAVMRECDRLGLADRAARLAACAQLLGLDELASTRDLTMGEAGWLARCLAGCATAAELPRPPLSPVAVLARILAQSWLSPAVPGVWPIIRS